MSYKSILVHVDASGRTQERIQIAANLAISSNAHLIGVATTGVSGLFYLPGTIGEGNVQLTTILELLQDRAQFALDGFEKIAQKMGVVSLEKRLANDEAGIGVSLQARYSDLVIIGQSNPDESSPAVRADFPEYVVMHSGRPVLVTPYAGRFDRIGKKVIIAWDASMQATRAVTAAIPLLKKAQTVQVVIFNVASQPGVHGEQPGADIALYLARHDIKVEVLTRTTATLSWPGKTVDLEVGNALLSHAADFDADLIVMGAYVHSRFREVLVGGVTSTIFKSMTIPTLVAH